MKRTAPAAILLATGLIAGCSTSEPLNQKVDFQSVVPAKSSTATLEVPPDLTAPQAQNKYSIPAAGTASASQMAQEQQQGAAPAATATPIVTTTTATASTVLPNVDKIHMERAGSQRWLVVEDKSAAELWPVLKAFWQDSGFTIKTEEPDTGLMETDWAENRAKLPNDGIRKLVEYIGLGGAYSTSERDMFRIRLEKGPTGGTEVYFSHQGLEEVYTSADKTQTAWQPRPVDPELEAEMLARFMTRLGLTNDQARQAVMSVQAPAQTQQSPIANGSLTINDSFDRAWRRVGLALDRIGLVVSDRDRSQGIYYVKPAQNEVDSKTEQSGGFWSKLWGSKPNAAAPVDDTLHVVIKEVTPGNTSITVTNKQGQVMNDSVAKHALQQLQNELQ